MNKADLTENVSAIATGVAAEVSVEFVSVKISGSSRSPHLQIFIEKENGVTHEDCKAFSHRIGEILDEKDFISDEYVLEVSSPGLERELYSLKDFVRFVGSLAKVRLLNPLNGQRTFHGRIVSVESEKISFNDKTAGLVVFTYNQVSKANLEIDIEEELKLGKSNK
jgi:ribosome maturation factor RimP